MDWNKVEGNWKGLWVPKETGLDAISPEMCSASALRACTAQTENLDAFPQRARRVRSGGLSCSQNSQLDR
jgi:hypothetical protein